MVGDMDKFDDRALFDFRPPNIFGTERYKRERKRSNSAGCCGCDEILMAAFEEEK